MGPLGVIGAGLLIESGVTAGLGLLQGYPTTGWIEPLKRRDLHKANLEFPNIIPGQSELFTTYFAGGCTFEQLKLGLAYNGVRLTHGEVVTGAGSWWDKVLAIYQPRISVDMALRLDALGKRGRESALDTIVRHGFRDDRDVQAILADSPPLGVDTILSLYWRGILNRAGAVKYLTHAGYRDSDIQTLLLRATQMYSLADYIRFVWSGVRDRNQLLFHAEQLGYRGGNDNDAMNELTFNWPSAGEALTLGLTQSFDDAYSQRWQLDNEKPGQLEYFLRKTGQSWDAAGPQPNGWANPGRTMGDYYWRSHWRVVDPATALELFRRLRPTGGAGGGPRVPGVAPFTLEQLTDVFQRAAIPPGIRAQLDAGTRPVPARLHATRLYEAGIIGRGEVIELFKDQGFSDTNAERMGVLTEYTLLKKKVDALRPITTAQVKEAYRVGAISRSVAAANLLLVYEDNPLKLQTLGTLPIEEQSAQAASNPYVQLALNTIDSDIRAELLKQGIEVYRKAYLRGEIDTNNARDSLVRMGIIFDRATQYVQLWTYELAAEGVELSAAKLVGYYIDHLIDQNTLFSRLIGLHYTPHDAQLIIASANLKLSEAAAKLQEKIGKAQQQQHKQLAAAAQQLQKQQAALSKQLCRSSSKSQLVAWATKRIIDYPSAFDRLTQCGMTPDDALNAFTAAADKKGGLTRDEIKEKIGPAFSPTEGNGQATTTNEQPGS